MFVKELSACKIIVTMDLQLLLSNSDNNDLALELDKILSSQTSSSTPSQLTELLKDIIRSGRYPHCQSCNSILFNCCCLMLYGQLYCRTCRQGYSESFGAQFNQIESYEGVDLGAAIFANSQWSVGDHLEFIVLAEEQDKKEQGQKVNVLELGKKMFNRKGPLQILQYLKSLSLQSNKKQLLLLEECPTASCLRPQNISFSIHSIQEIQKIDEPLSLFFDKFKAEEEQFIRDIHNTVKKSKNKKHLQFMDQMMLSELQENYTVYQQILKIRQSYKVQLMECPKKIEMIEDFTNTHEVIREEKQDIEMSQMNINSDISIKNAKEKELMAEFNRLMSISKIEVEKEEQSETYIPKKRQIKKVKHHDFYYNSKKWKVKSSIKP